MSGTADPRIERWLAKERPWRAELSALRSILLSEGLDEALKWRTPCYAAHGGNVAILASLSEAAAVSFFKGVLLDDPADVLEAPGPNSRSARYVKYTDVDQVALREETLRALIRQAIRIEAEGRKVALPADDLELPEELAEALGTDPNLAAAWEGLTPGRRRGYVVQISGAKQSATQAARVRKWAPRILAGKGIHDR